MSAQALVFVVLLALIKWCDAMPISTGSTYSLSSEEREDLEPQAEAGNKDAALSLYKHYRFPALDEVTAKKWLLRAAELGDPVSQYNIAMSFLREGDRERARYWATRALENGEDDAQEILGEIED